MSCPKSSFKSSIESLPRPNSPDLASSLAEVGLAVEDLSLTVEERAKKSWEYFLTRVQEEQCRDAYKIRLLPKVHPNPEETLPEGWLWGSFNPGDGSRHVAYEMMCLNCGKCGTHIADNCTESDTEEARRFRRLAGLDVSDEKKDEDE